MCNARNISNFPSSRAKTSERKSGIMRVRTLHDSLLSCTHSTCSSSSDSTAASSGCLAKAESLDNSRPNSVRFNDVSIREYAVTIGDNPSCSTGAPVSLDWVHTASDLRVQLDVFEEFREPRRRPHWALRMPKMVRIDLLMNNWNYSLQSIVDAEYETSKAREERMKTSTKAKKTIKREKSIRAMKHNVKKLFSIKGTNSDKRQNTDIISKATETAPPDFIMITK